MQSRSTMSDPALTKPPTRDDTARLEAEVAAACHPFQRLQEQMHRVIVGQQELLDGLIVGLLANGHLLIEGVPGLAKTTAIASLARGIRTGFKRIQFTPDLLPADLVGTLVYRPAEGDFVVKTGPIFSNLVLADEINRAPAKVQSALLEAMQERQVTIGDETHPLPEPFMVLATQNPIEQEGTYPLPEAQVDRFLMKLVVRYPNREEERRILDRMAKTTTDLEVEAVIEPSDIAHARTLIDRIHVDDRIRDYVVDLVVATREPGDAGLRFAELLDFGASPRATIALVLVAKARAFLAGRGSVVPQDVKDAAPDVLRHRLGLSYEAEAEERTADDLISEMLDHVPVP
jgi:MoxR-like ATPase